MTDEDPDINRIKCSMKTLIDDFKVNEETMVELYLSLSGNITEIRKLLQGKKVITWNYLEDLALEKPEDSEEFQVLLRTKGRQEIETRREFLGFKDLEDQEK